MELERARHIGASPAAGCALVHYGKERTEQKNILYSSLCIPTLTCYDHKKLIMTQRARSQTKKTKISSCCRVAELTFKNRVRISVTWKEVGVELLVLYIERI